MTVQNEAFVTAQDKLRNVVQINLFIQVSVSSILVPFEHKLHLVLLPLNKTENVVGIMSLV